MFAGITLFGNGWPVAGSRTITLRPKKGLAGSRSSLKSPSRIFRLGTVPVLVESWYQLIHSWAQKKKSLSRFSLNLPGMKTGPPTS